MELETEREREKTNSKTNTKTKKVMAVEVEESLVAVVSGPVEAGMGKEIGKSLGMWIDCAWLYHRFHS